MRFRVVAILIALAVLPAAGAQAQPVAQPRHPDPAAISLAPADLPGWTETSAVRQETWPPRADPPLPVGYGSAYGFESEFTQTTSDGTQLSLRSDVGEGAQADLDRHFAELQHDALDQPPIALPGASIPELAWWESTGSGRQAQAAAELDGVIIELELTGAPPAPVNPSSADPDAALDNQVAAWLGVLVQRAQAAPDQPPLDWSQLGGGQPWQTLLDQADVGSDWQPAAGLGLVSQELAPAGVSVSAEISYVRATPYQRTLTSQVAVFSSADSAAAQGMSAPGSAIDVPSLGDQTTAFRLLETDPVGTGDVRYTINVRQGAMVATIEDEGATTSLTSSDEAISLARQATARLSGAN